MAVVGLNEIDGDRLASLCERFGVARLDVFGSVVTGKATDDSDVDLLYELRAGEQLGWEIEDFEAELGKLFGRRVDLVSRRYLHPRLRAVVMAEARPLYAA